MEKDWYCRECEQEVEDKESRLCTECFGQGFKFCLNEECNKVFNRKAVDSSVFEICFSEQDVLKQHLTKSDFCSNECYNVATINCYIIDAQGTLENSELFGGILKLTDEQILNIKNLIKKLELIKEKLLKVK